MENQTTQSETAQSHIESRRARLAGAVGRTLEVVASGATPLSPERLEHFRLEAEELYWNELSWEELTDEELVDGGHLTELVFPGFLAFVDALLLQEVASDSTAPAEPHPDAVEEVLLFLGERYLEFTGRLAAGADSERLVWSRAMTARLIDLVLYRLHGIDPAEAEALEAID